MSSIRDASSNRCITVIIIFAYEMGENTHKAMTVFVGCLFCIIYFIILYFSKEKYIKTSVSQNVGPKRKGAVFLLKWFGIIVFV